MNASSRMSMVIIFSRTRRNMLGKTYSHLHNPHTASENFSRATLKKVFC
eukprot:UN07136